MSRREHVLLADDEPLSREFLQEALQGLGLEVHAVVDGEAACEALHQRDFDYVVTDLRMPHKDGTAVLAAAKAQDAGRPVVLVTAHGTMSVAVDAMRNGADDILEKPVALEQLEVTLHRLRERRRLLRENEYLRREVVGDELLVAGPALQRVVELARRVAPSKATVLITGESGTGKERLAALVHRASDRAAGPFVKLNCAALSESLLESELFGHEAGAFTGAGKRREGRFELADGGTLFLDEVGEMSPAMQAKLLRVLQEGELQRVGGATTIAVDVRVIGATNRNLRAEVDAGRFREDLFYRLNVVPLELPPLRERRDEILPLARHFLREGLRFDGGAETLLRDHAWPGNVRELQNVVQRAGLLCDGEIVDAELLVTWLKPGAVVQPRRAAAVDADPDARATVPDPVGALVGQRLSDVEEELILRTLEHCGGNRTRTAEVLGIGVRTLFNKLKEVEA